MGEPKADKFGVRPPVFPLTGKQTESVFKELKKRGATFFTDDQLRQLLKDNPKDTKIKDILDTVGGNQDLPEEILKK